MKITRYEQKGDELFIAITGDKTYLEHFFTVEEKETPATIKATIEMLKAKLDIQEEEYVEPLKTISKVAEAEAIKIDEKEVVKHKKEIKKNRADEKAKIEAEKLARIAKKKTIIK